MSAFSIPGPYSTRLERAAQYIDKIYNSDEITPNGKRRMLQWLFQEALLPLFRGIDFSEREISILIQGYVQHDGMGDFFHIYHAASLIQAKFPCAQITLGLEVRFLRKNQRRFPDTPFKTLLWGVSEKEERRLIYEDRDIDEKIKQECSKIAQNATMILDLPHSNYENSVGKPSADTPKSRILEYGVIATNLLMPVRDGSLKHGMGVHPLESGLAWKEPQNPQDALGNLSDLALQSIFSDGECGSYNHTHILHFAYIDTPHLLDFIKLCIAYSAIEQRETIDIVLPYREESLSAVLDMPNIKEVHTILKRPGEECFDHSLKKVQEKGKIIRLIHPFPLANEDMQKLIALSSGCIGCTGDLSFSETLSHHKLPLYCRPLHKLKFVESLQQLSEEFFSDPNAPLVRYLKKMDNFELQEERIELLRNPLLHAQMRDFCQYLRKHYNFNDVLIDIVSRNLALKYYPDLMDCQQLLETSYLENRQTLPACYHAFETAVVALESKI